MKIKTISYNNLTYNSSTLPLKKKESVFSSSVSTDLVSNLPSYALKANFLPTFGKFKKVKDITILDRDTGRIVLASLNKEAVGDFLMFKLFVNKKEVGFMNMTKESIFEEGDFILPEPTNSIPKVTHLRTLQGDKFAGIGSALLSVAVDESKKCGKNGALWLFADEGYARTYSAYRKNENPIPFYYKLGFISLDPDIDEQIKEAISTSSYDKLPTSTVLVLPSANADSLKNYYSSHYTKNLE